MFFRFVSDLPPICRERRADLTYHAQVWFAEPVFIAQVVDPAWKKKPSWYMVAKGGGTCNDQQAAKQSGHKAMIGDY